MIKKNEDLHPISHVSFDVAGTDLSDKTVRGITWIRNPSQSEPQKDEQSRGTFDGR
jgi:hypothetical protein